MKAPSDPFADFPPSKNRDTARGMLQACVDANPECKRAVIAEALKHWLRTMQLVEEARALAEKLQTHGAIVLDEHKAVTQAMIELAMRRN